MTPTVQAILQQLGRGINGALAYTGTKNVIWFDEDDGRPSDSKVGESGLIDMKLGVQLEVNGKQGQGWRIIITLESTDLYTVRLWRKARPTKKNPQRRGIVLSTIEGVYGDMLQGIVEKTYDDGLNEYNDGYFNI